jgi:hypothetical protein
MLGQFAQIFRLWLARSMEDIISALVPKDDVEFLIRGFRIGNLKDLTRFGLA